MNSSSLLPAFHFNQNHLSQMTLKLKELEFLGFLGIYPHEHLAPTPLNLTIEIKLNLPQISPLLKTIEEDQLIPFLDYESWSKVIEELSRVHFQTVEKMSLQILDRLIHYIERHCPKYYLPDSMTIELNKVYALKKARGAICQWTYHWPSSKNESENTSLQQKK